MDLEAYLQIDDLEQIAINNGIDIPRVRGCILMKDKSPVSKEEINEIKNIQSVMVADMLLQPNTISVLYEYRIKNRYLIKGKPNDDYEYVGIRWDRIHGKKRKMLKHWIKRECKQIDLDYDAWNRYAGKDNVLCIRSRMGGLNWIYYPYNKKKELMNQPWFLERVDSCWDNSYCNFYANIK